MKSRENLQNMLCEILGSNNVYFEPPENLRMNYPCIIYKFNRIENNHANNKVYIQEKSYTVTTVEYDPECPLADIVSKLPKCRHDRPYTSDGLCHNVFKLYY